MTLETIVYTLEEQLRLLGRQLVAADPLAPVQEEIDRFNEEEHTLERGLKRFLEQCARGLAEHAEHRA